LLDRETCAGFLRDWNRRGVRVVDGDVGRCELHVSARDINRHARAVLQPDRRGLAVIVADDGRGVIELNVNFAIRDDKIDYAGC
jgi:hypothetical protein